MSEHTPDPVAEAEQPAEKPETPDEPKGQVIPLFPKKEAAEKISEAVKLKRKQALEEAFTIDKEQAAVIREYAIVIDQMNAK